MLWLAFALTCMLTDWAALWKGRPSINYVSKTADTAFLADVVFSSHGTRPGAKRFCPSACFH